MVNKTTSNSAYWVDIICNDLEDNFPNDELIISSGISPSGPYHLGHAREVLTAEAIVRGMKLRGRSIRHIHFVDCFDALRKRYPYLPAEYEKHAGKPLFLVPAPDGKSESYAKQYFNQYLEATKQLGIEMEVIWAPDEYKNAKFANIIRESIIKKDQIASVIAEVSGRELEPDWLPIQILDQSNNSLRTAKFVEFDEDKGLVTYIGSDNRSYIADIAKGQVKLDWRVDWPARWKIWGNQVEGFGRDHATKGGSYDTGKAIIEKVFKAKAPYPIPYENINLKGDTKKMSSSLGNLVTISDVLKIIPTEILRYFTFKSKPERQLFFDPTIGLYNLIDEYAKTESDYSAGNEPEFKEALLISQLQGKAHSISTIPFSHLVSSYQAASFDINETFKILKRSGYQKQLQNQKSVIINELGYVKNWLDSYAPDSVKFVISKDTSHISLNKVEKEFITKLISNIKKQEFKADLLHQSIYDTSLDCKIEPKTAFSLIYKLFINKEYGPRAGYFLESLGKAFVLKRLNSSTKK